MAFAALRAIERLVPAQADVPTVPVSRFDVDLSSRWIEAEIDWPRLALLAISSGDVSGSVFGAELLLAERLGTGPHQQFGPERVWTPQGQVLDVFVTDFIQLAITEEASRAVPEAVRDPEGDAFDAAIDRLDRFLHTGHFKGSLIAPVLRGVLEVDTIDLDSDSRIEPFSDEAKRELWASHGWGSLALSPLPFDEVVSATHAIVIDVDGERLGGWDWSKAQERVPRAVLALRLATPGPVAAPWALLRPEAEFADYLVRLGAGGGLVSQPLREVHRGRFELARSQAPLVGELYRHLATASSSFALDLALRRLSFSYERTSDEDRLIDYWIAFEALFAPDQTAELRYRVSLRIARLLGRTGSEREAIFKRMRQSYDWRSHIVHGGGPPTAKRKKELGPFNEALLETEDALRRSLRLWLDPGKRPSLQAIDGALLR